jgi:hypothetical protein
MFFAKKKSGMTPMEFSCGTKVRCIKVCVSAAMEARPANPGDLFTVITPSLTHPGYFYAAALNDAEKCVGIFRVDFFRRAI